MASERAGLHRFRLWLGRRLIYPEALRIWQHYNAAADEHHRNGDHERENNCTYIAMGAKYVGGGWHG